MTHLRAVFALSVSLAVALPAAAQSARKPDPGPESLVRMNESTDALTRKVWPSVVQIIVTGYGTRAEQSKGDESRVVFGRQRSTGSGFVIDPDGYIMTNAHVVSGAQRIQVVLPPANADGTLATALSGRSTTVNARLAGIATELDLALLKVDVKLPALPLATYSELRQGETVFAFGSPIGLRNSLTHGLVSAVARQIDPDSPLIFIQTDAPINPGNSGGPLVNIRGEVVGVNTFILSQSGGNEGLGFAVPSATARTALKQLKQFGFLRRQEVGMTLQTITPPMAAGLGLKRNYGLIVSDVWPRSPAEKAGLKVGDVLVSVDGQPADNLPTVNYNFRLRDTPDSVKLAVLRGEDEFVLMITPVEVRSEFDSAASMADPEKSLVAELGFLGVEIDARIAAIATGLRDPFGIMVVALASGGSSDVPLQARDIIRSVNKQQVTTLQALRDTMRAMPKGTPVTLQIQRDGKLMFVTFVVE